MSTTNLPAARASASLPRRVTRAAVDLTKSVLTALAVGIIGMSLISACGWLKSEGTAAKTAIIDCAKQDLTAGSLLADVALALENGAGDWKTTLDALASKYGQEALACAVKTVDTVLTAHPNDRVAAEMSPGAVRGAQWLDEHQARFAR